jgi:hypothetical protein
MQIKIVANYNIKDEKEISRMSWFDYNFHIFALKKKQEEEESKLP